MMSQKGMSLIELLVVVTVIGVLSGLATLGYQAMHKKGEIDGEAKKVYADLQTIRSEALFRKADRSVKITPAEKKLAVYASKDGTGTVLKEMIYGEPITSDDNSAVLHFDHTGVASASRAYCLGESGNEAGVDSVAISTTSILIGKLSGGTCSGANITPK